jgi:hypothetical protein
VIRPVLWYASESWTIAKKSELALDAFERKVLRRILGPMKENNTWRIRYNNELHKQFDEPSIPNIKLTKTTMGRSCPAYGWKTHTEKDSGKHLYWKETCG